MTTAVSLTGGCKRRQVVELKPDWPKGYSRLGAAHQGLKQWDEAATAYEKGTALLLRALLTRVDPHRASRSVACSAGCTCTLPSAFTLLPCY